MHLETRNTGEPAMPRATVEQNEESENGCGGTAGERETQGTGRGQCSWNTRAGEAVSHVPDPRWWGKARAEALRMETDVRGQGTGAQRLAEVAGGAAAQGDQGGPHGALQGT